MTDAQPSENPTLDEHFSTVSPLPERLVRESIQNSLDAALNGGTVRVRFAFSAAQLSLDPGRASPYLDGLEEHLRAVGKSAQLLEQPLQWLVVEDFGTRGLTGDVHTTGANRAGNNFWGFFRQIGITTKGSDAAGSWGLGRWVFPDASQINAIMALTHRTGEDNSLLMGFAILKTHELNGKRYPHYGYFAADDPAPDHEWFPMPVSASVAPESISQTVRDFALHRGVQPGLSVIIPWPKDELTPASLARAVITQYFLPIMLGGLEVVIQHPVEEDRVINARLIADELEWIDESDRDDESEQSLRGLLKLTKWAYEQGEQSDHIVLPLPSASNNPLRNEDSDLDIAQLRERYHRGERLAFLLQTEVQRTEDSDPSKAACCVYLERADELDRGHDYFVRGNLRIPNIDHLRNQKARSLLLVEGQSPLGHLLRDAEGPAHVDWDKSRARVREHWARGAPARIDDVRRAPLRLVQALVERPAERQRDALADLFPSDVAVASARAQSTGGSGGGKSPIPPTIKPLSEPQPVHLQQVSGGFKLLPIPSFPLKVVGTTWKVKFAYELARGSKNKAFSLFEKGVSDGCPDFSVHDGIDYQVSGCVVHINDDDHNKLKVRIESEKFSLSVTGFDPNRDVLVEVDQDKSEEQAEDADEGEVA